MIEAQPSPYKGIMFRSRLERSWAVYLDLLRIPWTYESVQFAFQVEPGQNPYYTPDFPLTMTDTYVEVKPRGPRMAELHHVLEKCDYHGWPEVAESVGTTRGLIIATGIPWLPQSDRRRTTHLPRFPIVQHDRGLHVNLATLRPGGTIDIEETGWGPFDGYGDPERIVEAIDWVSAGLDAPHSRWWKYAYGIEAWDHANAMDGARSIRSTTTSATMLVATPETFTASPESLPGADLRRILNSLVQDYAKLRVTFYREDARQAAMTANATLLAHYGPRDRLPDPDLRLAIAAVRGWRNQLLESA